MSGIDAIILLALLLSMTISFFRGFYREIVSLLVWVAAVAITVGFTANFASLLPIETVESPQARLGISACILFFGTLMIGGLANWLAMKIVASRRQQKFDRVGGVIFGLLRGIVIVVILVLMANLTPSIKQEVWWRDSFLLPGAQRLAKSVYKRLPDEIAQHFSFSSQR